MPRGPSPSGSIPRLKTALECFWLPSIDTSCSHCIAICSSVTSGIADQGVQSQHTRPLRPPSRIRSPGIRQHETTPKAMKATTAIQSKLDPNPETDTVLHPLAHLIGWSRANRPRVNPSNARLHLRTKTVDVFALIFVGGSGGDAFDLMFSDILLGRSQSRRLAMLTRAAGLIDVDDATFLSPQQGCEASATPSKVSCGTVPPLRRV